MKIEDLVPDREICQEAKEKGVVIESEYYWFQWEGDKNNGLRWDIRIGKNVDYDGTLPNFVKQECPAPLTDEILLILPAVIPDGVEPYILTIVKVTNGYAVMYYNGKSNLYRFENKKLSNALLLLAIKLKSEGII